MIFDRVLSMINHNIQANNSKETWTQFEGESRSLRRKGERRKLKEEPRRYGHWPDACLFNSIGLKCNMLVRAAAMSASKTTPVEAEKVIINLMNIFILSLDDHNMLVR